MAFLNITYSKDLVITIIKVLLLLQVLIIYMGSRINAEANSHITITVKPNGNACLECPVNRSSNKSRMEWKYGKKNIFRDTTRTGYYDTMQATINTCSALHETLELQNVLMSFDDVFTCSYNRSEAARFKLEVKVNTTEPIDIDHSVSNINWKGRDTQSVVTAAPENEENGRHIIALIVLVPVLFLASILTSIGLFFKNKRQRTYTTNIKPPSRQTNSDNDDTAQGMTDNPVYDGVSDHDEHPNKDSPTENVNAQDGYQTTLAICLKTSRMFEYWSATYTKGENKDVKCFAKTLSGSATMNDARSFQELAITVNSLRAHSSIVKLLCISVDELPYSIFYEQLDGGSLRDFMMTHYQGARESHAASTGTGNQDFLQEKMKTELQELIYFASNINKGLRFLSGQKFCHPALCLKKVLLSSVGQCKLHDICPLTSAMRKVEELMKKERPPIAWMPPETIFMQEYYQASDVWGYAVLLWELFSFGEIPLARVSDSEIEKQIRGGFILPQPLCCPGAVYGIMLSSWSNRKRERPNFSTIATKLKTMVKKLEQREQPPLPAERNQDTTESNPVTDVEESAHSTSYFVLESKFQTNDYV